MYWKEVLPTKGLECGELPCARKLKLAVSMLSGSEDYHNSYFLKSFRDWNLLPISAIEAATLDNFTNQLRKLLIV